uniref:Uncharacterized protein n=1 Tax=Paracercomonas marina TaxID=372086 RepID=A0A0B5GFP4_9EUKA|nr:hypothetical protein [Paracercomonas marina]AJF22832.1 hypothetical protein [Paracercomonas marina]
MIKKTSVEVVLYKITSVKQARMRINNDVKTLNSKYSWFMFVYSVNVTPIPMVKWDEYVTFFTNWLTTYNMGFISLLFIVGIVLSYYYLKDKRDAYLIIWASIPVLILSWWQESVSTYGLNQIFIGSKCSDISAWDEGYLTFLYNHVNIVGGNDMLYFRYWENCQVNQRLDARVYYNICISNGTIPWNTNFGHFEALLEESFHTWKKNQLRIRPYNLRILISDYTLLIVHHYPEFSTVRNEEKDLLIYFLEEAKDFKAGGLIEFHSGENFLHKAQELLGPTVQYDINWERFVSQLFQQAEKCIAQTVYNIDPKEARRLGSLLKSGLVDVAHCDLLSIVINNKIPYSFRIQQCTEAVSPQWYINYYYLDIANNCAQDVGWKYWRSCHKRGWLPNDVTRVELVEIIKQSFEEITRNLVESDDGQYYVWVEDPNERRFEIFLVQRHLRIFYNIQDIPLDEATCLSLI